MDKPKRKTDKGHHMIDVCIGEPNIGFYAVAFFDVLGQSNKLIDVKRNPTSHDEVHTVFKELLGIIHPIHVLRDNIISFLSGMEKVNIADNPPPFATESEIRDVKEFTTPTIQTQTFSDTVVAFVKLVTKHGRP